MSKVKGNIRKGITNSRTQDSATKLIFGNNRLCSQFLRDYSGIELLKDVREEDIEDMTTRYIPMFTEERDSGPDEELREQGREEERRNTEAERKKAEAERQRADAAENRAKKAEARVIELEALLATKL